MARFFLVWLLLSIPCFSEASGKSEQLQGCYVEETYTSDTTEPEEKLVTVYNILKISKTSGGKWQFSAFFNGGNFHECGAWGTFKIEKTKDSTILIVTPDEDAIKELGGMYQCKLQILVSPASFEFQEAEGSQCESVFLCGARAHIDRQTFSRKNKVRVSDKRCTP